MATISSSPLLSPHLLPPPPASTLNPIILIIIILLLIAVLFSLPLLRHLRRRTPAALISPSLANRRSGSLLPPVFSFSSSTGYCAVCLSEIGRRDLLRRLPVCRHGFHAACIDTWLRFNQTCPLCRSPVHGGGGAHFRPETGSGG